MEAQKNAERKKLMLAVHIWTVSKERKIESTWYEYCLREIQFLCNPIASCYIYSFPGRRLLPGVVKLEDIDLTWFSRR